MKLGIWLLISALVAVVGCRAMRGLECSDLAEIRVIPFKGESVDDLMYNRLLAEDDQHIELLVSCIPSAQPMADPRKAPPYSKFAVGDVAVMVLADITGIPFEEALPSRVRTRLPSEGIDAYFEYVAALENRAALETQWRRLLLENSLLP